MLPKLLGFVLAAVVLVSCGFYFGTKFPTKNSAQKLENFTPTTITPVIQPSGLTCYVPNGIPFDASWYTCLSPISDNNFTLKNQVDCQLQTHQVANITGKEWQPTQADMTLKPKTDAVYNIYYTFPDQTQFALNFDYQHNEVDISGDLEQPKDKQPFVIIQNDPRIINAIRITDLKDESLGHEYEYLTLSKKTGKGVRTYSRSGDNPNRDVVFGDNFFQCK
jgi:hypothetical protein